MKSAMRLARLKNALKLSPHTVGRLVLTALVMASLGLVGWTIRSRYAQVKALEADIEKVPQLAAEVDRLKGQWTTQQIAQLESNYAKANELIFKTEDELDAWRLQIREQAGLSGLKVKDSLSAGRLLPQPDLALSNLVALCELEPAGPEQPSATPLYHRLLQFAHSLSTNQAKRADLVELAGAKASASPGPKSTCNSGCGTPT